MFLALFSVSIAGAQLRFFAFSDNTENPIFGKAENQLMINIGQGIAGTDVFELPKNPVPFNMFMLQYSQPILFFRSPARLSASITQTVGYGETECQYGIWNWSDYTTTISFLSTDTLILWTNVWYCGAGIGTGIQTELNARIGTRFLLAYKLFTGFAFANNWRIELFFHHFSNGSTSYQNSSYNFYGLGIGYNF